MNTPSVSLYKQNLVSDINAAIREARYSFAEEKLQELISLSGESDADYLLLSDYLFRSRNR